MPWLVSRYCKNRGDSIRADLFKRVRRIGVLGVGNKLEVQSVDISHYVFDSLIYHEFKLSVAGIIFRVGVRRLMEGRAEPNWGL